MCVFLLLSASSRACIQCVPVCKCVYVCACICVCFTERVGGKESQRSLALYQAVTTVSLIDEWQGKLKLCNHASLATDLCHFVPLLLKDNFRFVTWLPAKGCRFKSWQVPKLGWMLLMTQRAELSQAIFNIEINKNVVFTTKSSSLLASPSDPIFGQK